MKLYEKKNAKKKPMELYFDTQTIHILTIFSSSFRFAGLDTSTWSIKSLDKWMDLEVSFLIIVSQNSMSIYKISLKCRHEISPQKDEILSQLRILTIGLI